MSTRIKRWLPMAVATVTTLLIAACSSSQAPTAPSAQALDGTRSAPAPPAAPPATARYQVTFQGTWSAASHPVDLPSTAHFSPLVGGTHNASARFWNEGLLASTGIKAMAERRRTSPLDQEREPRCSRFGPSGRPFVFTAGRTLTSLCLSGSSSRASAFNGSSRPHRAPHSRQPRLSF